MTPSLAVVGPKDPGQAESAVDWDSSAQQLAGQDRMCVMHASSRA